MDMQAYVDEVKLSLTGGVLELELDDNTLQQIVNSALREMQRYICSTKIITIPYEKCIDLKKYKVNSVVRVYRAVSDGVSTTDGGSYATVDPVQIGLWQLTTAGSNIANFNEYASRYAAWSTIQQVGNTLATDLSFFYEDDKKLLYINTSLNVGDLVTIEFVPRYDSVEEVTSDFWIDVLMRLSKALTKIYLGRVRSRYTQSNALWQNDGQSLLEEGNTELTSLREDLKKNTQLLYPLD